MPDLLEHMYCAQQINIPPNLPYILKQYAKAAIRTQPYDLLFWSANYFRAKANNLPPPVKERLEYPPFDSPSRLSPGFLRVLHKQLGDNEYAIEELIYERWLGVCLVKEALDSMLKIGNMKTRIPWLQFVAIAAGHICSSLSKTMVLICEILTDQADGGAAWIPIEKFVELYEFLARLDCGPDPPMKIEIKRDESSFSSVRLSSAVVKDDEEPEVKEQVKDIGEKDSTTGLMVWPDVEPQEKPDRVRSPKHEDEPGASSELGVEVLDNAKGPVTNELVTLYPATTMSEVSEPSAPPLETETRFEETTSVGEGILSHLSLQENADWIKIEPKNLDGDGGGSDALDLDKLIESQQAAKAKSSGAVSTASKGMSDKEGDDTASKEMSEKEGTETSSKMMSDNEGTEKSVEKQDNLLDGDEDQELIDDKTTSRQDEPQGDVLEKTSVKEEIKSKTSEEEKSCGAECKPPQVKFGSLGKKKESGDSEERKARFGSTDSENELGESITMANFVKSRDMGYSVVEIRKGRFGDQSVDELSDDGPMPSETTHRFSAESTESLVMEDKEEKLPYWEHVPGIGPVIPDPQILAVVEYMQYWATKQQGMVGPRNINHLLCPPLDLPPPPEEEDYPIY